MPLGTEHIIFDSLTSDPSSPTDGQTWYNSTTTKFYKRVNGITEEVLFSSVSHKTSVRITTSASIGNLSNASATISGVTCVAGDRVLVINGASRDGVEAVSNAHNGVYVFGTITSGFGPLTRTPDANTAAKLAGMTIFCQGCGNGHALALAASQITLETTNLNYTNVAPLTSTSPADVTKAAAAVGTGTEAARVDHKHNVSTAAAVANPPGTANAEGSATSLARSDHTHSLPAYGSSSSTICQGNDSRLSDDRTASGLRSASTVVAVASATAPSSGQVLTATGSAAATWQTPASAAPTVTSAESSSSTTTTSTSDVLMNSMTITPASGTYLVWFSGDWFHSANNGTGHMNIYAAGSLVAASERYLYRGASQGDNGHSFLCMAKVTVNGSQAIEGKWRTSGATATNTCRQLFIHPVN